MSFLQELTEKLTTRTIRPYKASSVKPVYSFIKQLNGGQHPTSLEFLTDTTTVKNRLEKFATSTRRSVVFALRNVLDAYDRKDLLKLYEADIKAVQDGEGALKKGEWAETQKGHDKSWDRIMELQEEATKDYDGDMKGAVASVYTLLPPRRNLDYSEMKICFVFEKDLPNDFNYCVITEQGFEFVFNRYKTDGIYHQQVIDVPEDLAVILRKYITKQNKTTGDWLFSMRRRVGGEMMDVKFRVEDITDVLHSVFGAKISTQMLRHSFISKYNDPKYADVIKEMFGDAEAMGHSVLTQQNVYKK